MCGTVRGRWSITSTKVRFKISARSTSSKSKQPILSAIGVRDFLSTLDRTKCQNFLLSCREAEATSNNFVVSAFSTAVSSFHDRTFQRLRSSSFRSLSLQLRIFLNAMSRARLISKFLSDTCASGVSLLLSCTERT